MVDFLKDQHLETEMNHYWTERSKSYSEQNRAQIENEKRHEWENMILKYAPQKECLNILDVGTGPGFFAIILAQKGHHVTAVDLTQDMLEQAKENANHYKVEVEFKLLENQFLPFPDNTFDLVVSRDVTWMLQDAEGVLKEWYRVTKKAEKFCTLMPIGTTIYLMKMKKRNIWKTKRWSGKKADLFIINQKLWKI